MQIQVQGLNVTVNVHKDKHWSSSQLSRSFAYGYTTVKHHLCTIYETEVLESERHAFSVKIRYLLLSCHTSVQSCFSNSSTIFQGNCNPLDEIS